MKKDEKEISMEKFHNWKKVYSFFYRILITPPLRIASIVFSHGLTHFLTLIITGFIIGWLFFENNTIDIKPHHIGIDLQWTNSLFSILPEGTVTVEDSIRNLSIHVELNSKEAIAKTNGIYKNRLVLEFDGGEPIKQPTKDGVVYALLSLRSQGEEDSVMIKLFSDPILSDARIEIEPEDFIFDKSQIKRGWTVFTDSLSDTLGWLGPSIPVFSIANPDTTKYVYQYDNSRSIFTIKIIPAKYKVNGKTKSPRQKVYIYSNKLGVEKNNPFYYYFIAFPSSKLSGNLKFDFITSDLIKPNDFNFSYAQDSHLQYNYIFPQPDIINNGYIEFHTKEKIDAIKKNRGIIIQAVDVNRLNHLTHIAAKPL